MADDDTPPFGLGGFDRVAEQVEQIVDQAELYGLARGRADYLLHHLDVCRQPGKVIQPCRRACCTVTES